MESHVQVTTTADRREVLDQIARTLVDERLAACAQVSGPLTSIYRWQGRVERAEEWCCTLKTSNASLDRLLRRLGELHPYDEPEIIAVPIVGGSAGYLAWIDDETRG